MPRTPAQAAGFLIGFWLILALLVPLHTPGARAGGEDLLGLEAELHRAVNAWRHGFARGALERRPELDALARAHSVRRANRAAPGVPSPDPVLDESLAAAGLGPFVASGANMGDAQDDAAPALLLADWQRSPAARERLESASWDATGIGIARTRDGRLFYTQLYVARAP